MSRKLFGLISTVFLSTAAISPAYSAPAPEAGVLRVFASATNDDEQTDTFQQSQSVFTDTITVSTPGIDRGYLIGSFSLDGELSGIDYGQSFFNEFALEIRANYFDSNLNNNVTSEAFASVGKDGRSSSFLFYSNVIYIPFSDMLFSYDDTAFVPIEGFVNYSNSINIGYKSDVPFSFEFKVNCLSTATGVSYASCDFLNTAAWTGILGITDLSGETVPTANVTSVSGFDYVTGYQAAVPEPEIWTLWLAGFGVAGLAVRMRRPVLNR